jgi:hypothetical protein
VGGRAVEGWSIFRAGCKPEWEDPLNITGSEIQIGCDKLETCDSWWFESVLAVVGGVLPTASEVTGLRIIDKCKKGAKQVYRLEVWYTAEADAQGIRTKFQELLSVNNEIKTKRHSNKPAVQQLTKQKTNDKDPDRPQVQAVPKVGREKEARALLAKLTPEKFEKIMPQLRGLLADGVVETLDAVVVCLNQCMLQTVIFHKMFAELTAAIPSVQVGVVASTMLHLESRDAATRYEAKLAASFAAALFAAGVLSLPELVAAAHKFASCDLDVEVLCILLAALEGQPTALRQMRDPLSLLRKVLAAGQLSSRLRFLVQDVLTANQ